MQNADIAESKLLYSWASQLFNSRDTYAIA